MTKFCMSVDIHDVITCATFCDDRLRGLGVARGRISRFPIDLRRRPYNTLALPCECVIHDASDTLASLDVWPSLKPTFIKLNTPLPASAACERLFSATGWV